MRDSCHLEVGVPFAQALKQAGLLDFDRLMRHSGGGVYSLNPLRSVVRIGLNNDSLPGFFLKRHFKTPVGELIKDLVRLRWPRSAGWKEWRAGQRFQKIGILTYTPVAWGERTFFLRPRDSFFISLEVQGAERVEDYVVKSYSPPLSRESLQAKRELAARLAHLAKTMHRAGLNHHDFYLGHILIKRKGPGQDDLYVIDLQRVEARRRVPRRLIIKDLAQLNFTASSQVVTLCDRIRFLKLYLGCRKMSSADKRLAIAIGKKTEKISRHTARVLERRRKINR
ncbi:MAG: lipopolysaccharide kinase InaA family protein [Thermodesulfobacteriota bacterium]